MTSFLRIPASCVYFACARLCVVFVIIVSPLFVVFFSVYLRCSPEVCAERIRKRDRKGESNISMVRLLFTFAVGVWGGHNLFPCIYTTTRVKLLIETVEFVDSHYIYIPCLLNIIFCLAYSSKLKCTRLQASSYLGVCTSTPALTACT